MENTKIAWLAGLIDGEGSIGMYAPFHKRKFFVRYQVTIANDNTDIIAEALRIISEILGREAYLASTYENECSFVHHKITVAPQKDCIKLLTAVEPYLVGKKAQAQVLLKLLKGHKLHSRYTRAELDVINILKKMKDDNKTSAGNAELNSEKSDKCVENIETVTQYEMIGLKTCSDTP